MSKPRQAQGGGGRRRDQPPRLAHLRDGRAFECGIELQGTEVKSLRDGKAQIGDAYAVIEDGEVWLRDAHIPPYAPAADNHDPERPRKLLLHRYEIDRSNT